MGWWMGDLIKNAMSSERRPGRLAGLALVFGVRSKGSALSGLDGLKPLKARVD